MCGIVGMISVGEQGNNQFGMMIPNVIYRGRDYFGFSFQDSTGAVHTTKDPNLTKLLQQYMVQTNNISMRWAMANARAIPESEWIEHPEGAKDSDCQPAESANFVCVLNGCIANDKELRKKYKLEVESTVDTYVIPALLEFYIDKGLSPDNAISNTIMELEGSFACIIAHKNTSTFYVLSNFVPLYTVYDPIAQIYYFASMPEWFEVLKGCTYAQSIAPYKMCKIQPGKKIQTTSILKTLPNKRMLCICSSGMDSLTTARLYQCLGYEVELLHYDYGCAASEKEIENIQRSAQLMNMKLRILDAKAIFDMFKGKSRLLTDDKTLNDGAQWLTDAESITSDQRIFVCDQTNKIESIEIGQFIDMILKQNAINSIITLTGEKMDISRMNYKTIVYDKELNMNIWKPINRIFRHIPKTEIYNIIGRKGLNITVTGEHSIFRFNRKTGDMELINSKDILPGDFLYALRGTENKITEKIKLDIANILEKYPLLGRRWLKQDEKHVWTAFSNSKQILCPRHLVLDEDFAFILGAWTAEGGVRNWGVKNEEFAKLFVDKFNKTFNQTSHYRKQIDKTWGGYWYELSIPSVISRIFETMCGSGVHNKQVPNEIFSSPESVQWAFIEGLWRGDGSVDFSRGYNIADLQTVSSTLAKQVTTLLKLLGCQSGISFNISNHQDWSDVWETKVSDAWSYNLLAKNCGYPLSKNAVSRQIPVVYDWIKELGREELFGNNQNPKIMNLSRLKKLNPKLHKKFDNLPFDFIEVLKVNKVDYKGYVYDLGIDDIENFYINEGYLVHNSTISYVPARNSIFAIVAASIAEQEEFTYISQGLNLIDGSAYPDNQLTYLTKMNELMPYALSWNSNVQFKAPLVHLTKREILQLALHLGVPLQSSWSCYRSKKKRCGDCGPDKFRMYAFQKLGYKDIVEYEKVPEGFWDNCVEIPKTELNLMQNPRAKLPNPKEHTLWEYIRKEI